MCEIKIQQDFIAKNKIRCDKKTYPKSVLNKVEVIKGLIFMYTI